MRMKIRFAAIALMALAAAPLEAQSLCSTQLGSLPVDAFGGSGIPTDRSMVNSCVSGLTLGLKAHTRGNGNPAVTDDGLGTYFASAGPDVSSSPPAVAGYATWNFGFYVGGANAGQYSYKLRYDFDAAAGNTGNLGVFSFSNFAYANSWNLGMSSFLAVPSLFFAPPTGPAFNPNAGGEYAFALEAYSGQTLVASTAMTVSTVSTVPEPSTYVLMASGLLGLFVAHRRRRNA
jgi:PEP-CTERM motif